MTSELSVDIDTPASVGVIEMRRPPHNYFDAQLVSKIANILEAWDDEPKVRAILLSSAGRSFCAGADLSGADAGSSPAGPHLYDEAVRLFRTRKPVVAAIQGAAIGGGFGLAMAADFRVAGVSTRFSANFVKLGFHPGFGLTETLPRSIGYTQAARILFTGRDVAGPEALSIGLVSQCVPDEMIRREAFLLAAELASMGPVALQMTRETMRRGLGDAVAAAMMRERSAQDALRSTADFAEGVRARRERRPPVFRGG